MSCTLVGVSWNGRSLRFDAPLAQAEAESLAKKKAEAERVGMGRVCCKRCVHQLSIRAFIRLFVPQIAAEQAEAARKAAEAAKVVEYSIIHMTYVIIIAPCTCSSSRPARIHARLLLFVCFAFLNKHGIMRRNGAVK